MGTQEGLMEKGVEGKLVWPASPDDYHRHWCLLKRVEVPQDCLAFLVRGTKVLREKRPSYLSPSPSVSLGLFWSAKDVTAMFARSKPFVVTVPFSFDISREVQPKWLHFRLSLMMQLVDAGKYFSKAMMKLIGISYVGDVSTVIEHVLDEQREGLQKWFLLNHLLQEETPNPFFFLHFGLSREKIETATNSAVVGVIYETTLIKVDQAKQ